MGGGEENGDTLTADNAIFIDETPFSFTILRRRGRGRKGVPAVQSVSCQLFVVKITASLQQFRLVTVCCTGKLRWLSLKLHSFQSEKAVRQQRKTGKKGVTRDVFRTFVIELLQKPMFSAAGAHDYLVCDNANIHKGDIDEVIFQAGHEQLFLPPYSCELNPIENVFSTWKLAYRVLFPATEEEVDEAIHRSATSITAQGCLHCFEHTRTLYAAALAMEDL